MAVEKAKTQAKTQTKAKASKPVELADVLTVKHKVNGKQFKISKACYLNSPEKFEIV